MLEDVGRSILGDAWQWLPCKTRCMLLGTATGLAELAVQEKDEVSCPGTDTSPSDNPCSGEKLVDTSTNPLFMPHKIAHTSARRSSSSSAAAAATGVPQALHSMAQQLADGCHAVCSPLLTAMEIVNLGKTVSEPIVESVHLANTSSSDVISTGSTVSFFAGSAAESPDTYLYMLLMRASLATGMAISLCDDACQRIHTLAADSGSVSEDIVLLSISLVSSHQDTLS